MSDFYVNVNYYFAVVVLEAVKTPQNLPQPILVGIFVLVVLASELPVYNRLLQVAGERLEDALLVLLLTYQLEQGQVSDSFVVFIRASFFGNHGCSALFSTVSFVSKM